MQVPVEQIVRVYRGRPGCGCGCRGKYWEDQRNIRRVVKMMNERADEVREDPAGIFSVEDDKHFMWAYTRNA